jgi:outer membrane receptor for monomeric catechols
MDLPQSIMTIDRQVLDNQQVLKMSDVLMNTNGVYIMSGAGGYQEELQDVVLLMVAQIPSKMAFVISTE